MVNVFGTSGSDVLVGTTGNDVLVGDPQGPSLKVISLLGSGLAASGASGGARFSPDGNRVVFQSVAADLVTGDTNGKTDILIKNLLTRNIDRVSVNATGGQANDHSSDAVFSPDGGKVLFSSSASDLVPGDTNGRQDVFVKDLATGAVTVVSVSAAGVQGNDLSFGFAFSPDGNSVIFQSAASNLTAGDTGGHLDIFLKSLVTGVVDKISASAAGLGGDGDSFAPQFSPDGNFVVFHSAARNLTADSVGTYEIYLKNISTGAVTLISKNAAGDPANQATGQPVFSPDGTRIAYSSNASNLVAGDLNGMADIFIYDIATQATQLVSLSALGVSGNGGSYMPRFSPDGTKIVFHSYSTNWAANDANAGADLFVKDLITGEVTRVSSLPDGSAPNGYSFDGTFLPDGSGILFASEASNLFAVDSNGVQDVFLYRFSDFGSAPDHLNGGDGTDTASYEPALVGVTVDLRDGTGASNSGDAAGDTYTSIEIFRLSNHNDVFHGSDTPGAANVAWGLDGEDAFHGGGAGTTNNFNGGLGNDTFNGGAGRMAISAGDGDDTATGGAGAVNYWAGAGSDTLNGGTGDDVAHGGTGADTLQGAGGKDILYGEDGGDTLDGGLGNDLLRGGAGSDVLHGNEDSDKLYGDAGVDTLHGDEGKDFLYGGADGDSLFGGEGRDNLNGEGGDDILSGGDGGDYLRGGLGADSFVFGAADTGTDVVYDYELGLDGLRFSGLTADDLTLRTIGTWTDILIETSGAHIRVMGVANAAALADDFTFLAQG
jgi:Tol biopolymer transport system component